MLSSLCAAYMYPSALSFFMTPVACCSIACDGPVPLNGLFRSIDLASSLRSMSCYDTIIPIYFRTFATFSLVRLRSCSTTLCSKNMTRCSPLPAAHTETHRPYRQQLPHHICLSICEMTNAAGKNKEFLQSKAVAELPYSTTGTCMPK